MILGIDIGGTTTKLGLVDGHRVSVHARMMTTGHADEHAFADAIVGTARHIIDRGGAIAAIGIGAPNGNQHTGTIHRAPNLPWKNDVPLARMIGERLGVPCVLGNDANAAALGEWKHGAGRGCNDLLVVTLGTGLGSGFIINGQLLLGPFGNAGELGHLTLVVNGRPCTCGRRGCLEAYVSIRGMKQTYSECGGGSMDGDGVLPIADAAKAGDKAAAECFARTAEWLAVGLANAVAIAVPEKIILFGGIARNGELLMAPLREHFEEALLNIYRGKVRLMLSELPEDDAGILGAAALAESRS